MGRATGVKKAERRKICIAAFAVSRIQTLPKGKTLTVKEGWNMTTLDGVQYSLSIDGQAGYTVEFAR